MRWLLGLVAAVTASCGPGLAPTPPRDKLSEPLVAARGNAQSVRALLHAPVVYAGLLFDDPTCVQSFVAPGELRGDQLDAFARCLGGLNLQHAARVAGVHGVSVLSYGGVEVEARLASTPQGPALQWIGFVGRHDLRDAMPTITAAELESLRTTGERRGTLSADARRQIDQELGDRRHAQASAWLMLCLDTGGQVTSVRPIQVSSAIAFDAFSAAVADWRFRPFMHAARAVPACSYVRLAYPLLGDEDAHPERLPVALFAKREHLVVDKPALGRRVEGTDVEMPDAASASAIDALKMPPLWTVVGFCLDERGGVVTSALAESSGVPSWDAQLVELVRGWRYAPFLLHGQPTPICSSTTFSAPSAAHGSVEWL